MVISSNPADCRSPLSPLRLWAPASAYHQAKFQPLVTPTVHALPTQGHADLSAPVGLRRSSPPSLGSSRSTLPRTRLDWVLLLCLPWPPVHPLASVSAQDAPPEALPISHPPLRVRRVLHASFTGHCPQLYSLCTGLSDAVSPLEQSRVHTCLWAYVPRDPQHTAGSGRHPINSC